MSDQLKLWFFRDLNDEQRLKLFGLFDLPIKDIGKNHGKQDVALQYIMKAMIKMVAEATAPAPEKHVAGAAAIRKAGDAAVEKLVDRFALTHFMPDSDELTDYLRSIVDACVKAATERSEG